MLAGHRLGNPEVRGDRVDVGFARIQQKKDAKPCRISEDLEEISDVSDLLFREDSLLIHFHLVSTERKTIQVYSENCCLKS